MGCDDRLGANEAPPAPLEPATASAPIRSAVEAVGAGTKQPFAPSRAGCDAVEVFDGGASAGSVCRDDAKKLGLTVLDLSDEWTPRVFAADAPSGKVPEYRAKYLELASSTTADLGLYGVSPTLSVLAGRLSDEKRRSCDAAVDLAPLAPILASWSSAPDDRSRATVLRGAEAPPAMRAIQSELACAGFLKPASISGSIGPSTRNALDAFHRRHLIVGAGLDADTLQALSLGGDELAFRGLLRGLRERVADAAGLVEDGSASGERALVLSLIHI